MHFSEEIHHSLLFGLKYSVSSLKKKWNHLNKRQPTKVGVYKYVRQLQKLKPSFKYKDQIFDLTASLSEPNHKFYLHSVWFFRFGVLPLHFI